jgi:hypothetical protein
MSFPHGADATDLPTGLTRADFHTGRQRICADVDTGGRRLLDALRDPTRKYLDVRRARVAAASDIGAPVEYQAGLLSKDDIEWVAVRAEPPRAEARLYAFVRKVPVRVALVLGACRVEGTVHVDSGATDPAVFFLRGLEKSSERFLAVTNATLTPAADPAATAVTTDEPAALVIVNRAAVRLYSILRQKPEAY